MGYPHRGAPANSDASLKSNATKNLLASTLINPKDPQDMGVATGQDPVRIHAGGDPVFDGVTLNVAKSSLISANGNIEDLNYVGQHQLSTDVTRIVAGGDLRGQENRPGTRDFSASSRCLAPASCNSKLARIWISKRLRYRDGGLAAGRWQGGCGASLRVAAGAAKSVDAQAFAQRYLNEGANRQALIAYVQDTLKVTGLSYEQAWAAFQTLTQAHQVAFVEPFGLGRVCAALH